MEHFVSQMLRVEDHFCQDRIQTRFATQQRAFVAPAPFRAKAPFCELCFKSFHLLSQKLQCFFCHKMACKRCAYVIHAETMAFPKKLRVCTTCYCPTARRRTSTAVHSDTLSDEASSVFAMGGPIALDDDDDKPRTIQLYHPSEMRQSSLAQPTTIDDDDEWGFTRTTALSVLESRSSFSSYAPSAAAGDSTRGQYGYH
ncbi:hypothetical protein SPRG_16215 [Saprolegnia parasitica CBS 223.65]|uniref:FYVE-type domain-containing protein n=1 Tax=Saprolegnia parasitica (strain CBS 223.65) TaxID=695850 RepID=A0A067BNR7_SAPPC|nr:hypothetical protein SPRG_16215 [Saprolegnia parasitica CBS 223.65]KDO18395.1 hypothetical protein SPRG_16215 [Saprolegnia parasitica CBS 223.65]|eukprot:XP_012210893.1 hypothetical protein SPRG_16215 [Saprolegnia parasitica CBS 223.65]